MRLGLSQEEVRALLGAPDDFGYDGRVWKYGSLEISFADEKTALIGIYLWEEPVSFPPALSVDLGPFEPRARAADVQRALDEAGIAWAVNESLTFDDQTTLTAGASVRITFDEGRLDKLIVEHL